MVRIHADKVIRVEGSFTTSHWALSLEALTDQFAMVLENSNSSESFLHAKSLVRAVFFNSRVATLVSKAILV